MAPEPLAGRRSYDNFRAMAWRMWNTSVERCSQPLNAANYACQKLLLFPQLFDASRKIGKSDARSVDHRRPLRLPFWVFQHFAELSWSADCRNFRVGPHDGVPGVLPHHGVWISEVQTAHRAGRCWEEKRAPISGGVPTNSTRGLQGDFEKTDAAILSEIGAIWRPHRWIVKDFS